MLNLLGIAEGGEDRLRQAIEAQVRREHLDELAATNDHWKKADIEEKIKREIKERLKGAWLRPIPFGLPNDFFRLARV